MDQKKIDRINELAKKSKSEGLTAEEKDQLVKRMVVPVELLFHRALEMKEPEILAQIAPLCIFLLLHTARSFPCGCSKGAAGGPQRLRSQIQSIYLAIYSGASFASPAIVSVNATLFSAEKTLHQSRKFSVSLGSLFCDSL